jgi:hypothetical protein
VTGRRYGDASPGQPGNSPSAPRALPAEKAQSRAESAAERTRLAAAGPPCSCVRPDVLDGDGRCSRCYGRPGGGR